MLFAFNPVAVVAVPTIAVIAIMACAAYLWLKRDAHRDMVVFMGPKTQGKTEFSAALLQRKFDPEREGTARRPKETPFTIEEESIGCKKLVTFDADGAGDSIRDYVKELVKYIDEKHPDYVFIVLVIKRSFLKSHGIQEVTDKLGEYLNYAAEAFDNDLCRTMKHTYLSGAWAYAVIMTNCEESSVEEKQKLVEITDKLMAYKGKLRSVDSRGVTCFELSKAEDRRRTIRWLVSALKKIHEG